MIMTADLDVRASEEGPATLEATLPLQLRQYRRGDPVGRRTDEEKMFASFGYQAAR
jgi:hypothetical protein